MHCQCAVGRREALGAAGGGQAAAKQLNGLEVAFWHVRCSLSGERVTCGGKRSRGVLASEPSLFAGPRSVLRGISRVRAHSCCSPWPRCPPAPCAARRLRVHRLARAARATPRCLSPISARPEPQPRRERPSSPLLKMYGRAAPARASPCLAPCLLDSVVTAPPSPTRRLEGGVQSQAPWLQNHGLR